MYVLKAEALGGRKADGAEYVIPDWAGKMASKQIFSKVVAQQDDSVTNRRPVNPRYFSFATRIKQKSSEHGVCGALPARHI